MTISRAAGGSRGRAAQRTVNTQFEDDDQGGSRYFDFAPNDFSFAPAVRGADGRQARRPPYRSVPVVRSDEPSVHDDLPNAAAA